jgi:hypothetical protein
MGESLRGHGVAEAIQSLPTGATGLLRALCALAMTIALLAGCSSPEATRTRGGGPGADVKNWGQPVEIHAGAKPYYDTPCVTDVECHGPRAVFGPTPPPD